MAGCPPVEQLRGFASGILADDAAAAIESHVDTCPQCRSSVAELAKGSARPGMDQPPMDVEGRIGKRLGRYRIDRVLGMGGMGIVYAAWDPQLDRPVAIKVVHKAAADAAGRARLVREAQSLARLSHPNVCHVYDVGTDPSEANPEGDVWVAMELIDGSTLREWAPNQTQAVVLAALLGAGDGIAAAHAAGLIHRDIKPENVLVTRDGRPVVTDFGLARLDLPVDPTGATAALDPLKTATNAIVGTPAYLAPEQLTGGTLDARVDQFAWAVMAWELLAGVRPFPAIPIVRLDAIVAGPKPHPSLAKPLAAALAKAMAAAPRDRFGSMRELMEAVKPASHKRGHALTFAVIGGVAVVAVAATIIVWKVMTPAAPPATPVALAPVTPPVTPPTPVIETPKATATGSDAAALEPTKKPEPKSAAVVSKPAIATKPAPPAPKTAPKPDVLEVSKSPRPPGGGPTPLVVAPPEKPSSDDAPQVPAGAMEAYLAQYPYDKGRAVAVLTMACRIPSDAAKPGPEPGMRGVVDWGKVTRRELGILKLGNRGHHAPLYEVKGARGTYQMAADHWSNTVGVPDLKVGQWVALCYDDITELYEVPANWRRQMVRLQGIVPLSRPPRVTELAKWNPLHISDLALRRDGGYGKTTLDTSRRFLLRAKVEGHEGGNRWDMSKWWLDVPAGIPGAGQVAVRKHLWFVVEDLKFEEQADGSQPRLVVRALAVVDDLFP
jgi:serine/threonine protein kinase